METKFKDVAHLYMGCEIQYTAFLKDEQGNVTDKWSSVKKLDTYNFTADLSRKDMKPILRPLSDMTELEMNEIQEKSDKYYNDAELDTIRGMACVTAYFLSKQFDLFQLIEAGEAIDATTFIRKQNQ